MTLKTLIGGIEALDEAAMRAAQQRQERLTKPRGSLGRLEELASQIAGVTRQATPRIEHIVITVMAGDHGVVAEGVSAYPQEVTAQMVQNFLHGGAAINVLARQLGARVVVVDMGVASDLPPHPDLIIKKIAYGTRNLARGPAMTLKQAEQAILAGAEVAQVELENGMDLLCTGDMGIGNTTPSAAIAAAFTGLLPVEFTGRGTGLDRGGLKRKSNAVAMGLSATQPNPEDGLDVLAKVGGFEIAGLAGAILATAAARRPVVVDGFISTAAAMVAVSLAPQVRPYLIAAHRSQERGHDHMLEWLGARPLLDLGMRLGEGTGAALAAGLVRSACALLGEMATFDEAGVSEKQSQ